MLSQWPSWGLRSVYVINILNFPCFHLVLNKIKCNSVGAWMDCDYITNLISLKTTDMKSEKTSQLHGNWSVSLRRPNILWPSHNVAASAWQRVMYIVPLQCFCPVALVHVTVLTVKAPGTETLLDTDVHGLIRLQRNGSWLPEAICHCRTELMRTAQVKGDVHNWHTSNVRYVVMYIRVCAVT